MSLLPEQTFATVTQLGAVSKAPWSLRIAQPALARAPLSSFRSDCGLCGLLTAEARTAC